MNDDARFCKMCGSPVEGSSGTGETGLGVPETTDSPTGGAQADAQPTEQPAEQPAAQPAEQPVEQPTAQPAAQPIAQPAVSPAQGAEPAIEATPPAANAAAPMAVMPGQQENQQPGQQPSPKRSRRKAIIAGAVVVALIAVGVGVGLWWKSDQDAKEAARLAAEQAEWEHAHTTLITKIDVDAPGFDDNSTAIPVQVTGTDLDGNTVNKVTFVRPSSMQVEIVQGSYDYTIPCGYLTSEGDVVQPQTKSFHVEAWLQDGGTTEGKSGESASSQQSEATPNNASISEIPKIAFTKVEPLDVTDEMISDIQTWSQQDDQDNGRAAQLGKTASEIHRSAVEEEEARKRAEALQQAAFGDMPQKFIFTSGMGAWSSTLTLQQDGSFAGSWSDSNMGESGPGYKATVHTCSFEGSFTALEQISDTDIAMQLDYVRPTTAAGESIDENKLRTVTYDDKPVGLGEMTETPVGGWHLLKPGHSTSGMSTAVLSTLFPGGLKSVTPTLSTYALVNEELGYGWPVIRDNW